MVLGETRERSVFNFHSMWRIYFFIIGTAGHVELCRSLDIGAGGCSVRYKLQW